MDTLTDVPAVVALNNLASLHRLAPLSPNDVRTSSRDGHLVYHVAVPQAQAERWRAAFAAPAYTETRQQYYSTWRTRALWLGAEVRLLYTTL